jgi:hypothetical protein
MKLHNLDREKMFLSYHFRAYEKETSLMNLEGNIFPELQGINHEYLVLKVEPGWSSRFALTKVIFEVKILSQWKKFVFSFSLDHQQLPYLWGDKSYMIFTLGLQRDQQRGLRYALLSFPSTSFPYEEKRDHHDKFEASTTRSLYY